MGCDFIEPDLVSTRDGVLIVRHENCINDTTNVAEKPEFESKKTTKVIDGEQLTGWFVEDFTLEELMTLRCKERIPDIRPGNAAFNGQYPIATFQDVIDLAKEKTTELGRVIGVYPETKHPSYFRSIGLPLEERMLETLSRNGWNHKDAPVIIQSFEVANLRALRKQTDLFLLQLVNAATLRPQDAVLAGSNLTYGDMVTKQGLSEVATYCDAIGVLKDHIIPRDDQGCLKSPTKVVEDAKSFGLRVHIWTMRPEAHFLPKCINSEERGSYGISRGAREIIKFLEAGVDGFFTDASDVGREAITIYQSKKN
jgi:glycerophosphoryl diester phosphodiesterase